MGLRFRERLQPTWGLQGQGGGPGLCSAGGNEVLSSCQDRDLGAWSQLLPHFSAVLHIRAPGKSCLDILHFVLISFTLHPRSGSYQGLLLIPVATSLFPACLTSQPHLTQTVLPFSVTQPLLFRVSPLSHLSGQTARSPDHPFYSPQLFSVVILYFWFSSLQSLPRDLTQACA